MKLPRQVVGVPVQLPLLHVVGVVTWFVPVQVGAPEQEPFGYWQVPLPSQLVAPQVPPVVQAAVQQLPLVPVVPHTLLAQSLAVLHDWPATSRHSFPLTQV
jgi:hypothetical protein